MTTGSGYALGINIGTTSATAAVATPSADGTGPPVVDIVTLGQREAAMPSVVHIGVDDGTADGSTGQQTGAIAVGEAALRRAGGDHSALAKEFRRRIGDETPILVGGASCPPRVLLAHQIRAVYDRVVERMGTPPASIVLSHPASWGPFKIQELEAATVDAGIGGVGTDGTVELIAELLAAATDLDSRSELTTGAKVLVYHLGGATFDTAVIQRGLERFVPVGPANGLERLGGAQFDQAVFDHVRASVAGAFDDLDRQDPVVVAALLALRERCRVAKETLSDAADANIGVVLPGLDTSVRLTRNEFEAAVRPMVADTLTIARRTITEAGLEPTDLDAVMLVGGSASIPVIAELVNAEFEVDVAVDANPRFAVARGAAIFAAAALPTAGRPIPDVDDGQPILGTVTGVVPPEVIEEATASRAMASLSTGSDPAIGLDGAAEPAIRPAGTSRETPRRPATALAAAATVIALLLGGGGAAAAFGAGPFGGEPKPAGIAEAPVTTLETVTPSSSTLPTTVESTTTAPSSTAPSSTTAAIASTPTTAAQRPHGPTTASTHHTTPSTTEHHHTTTTHHGHTTTTHHGHTTTTHHDDTTTTEDHHNTTTTDHHETTTTTEQEDPDPTTKELPIITLIGPPITQG